MLTSGSSQIKAYLEPIAQPSPCRNVDQVWLPTAIASHLAWLIAEYFIVVLRQRTHVARMESLMSSWIRSLNTECFTSHVYSANLGYLVPGIWSIYHSYLVFIYLMHIQYLINITYFLVPLFLCLITHVQLIFKLHLRHFMRVSIPFVVLSPEQNYIFLHNTTIQNFHCKCFSIYSVSPWYPLTLKGHVSCILTPTFIFLSWCAA